MWVFENESENVKEVTYYEHTLWIKPEFYGEVYKTSGFLKKTKTLDFYNVHRWIIEWRIEEVSYISTDVTFKTSPELPTIIYN